MIQQYQHGALASQAIAELFENGHITNAQKNNIQPASLDLSLSDEIYKVNGIFQPRPGESVRDVLDLIEKEQHNIDQPLDCQTMYIARLNETLSLPKDIYGFCNPKSTTGRLDIHTRLMADGVPRYDSVTAGYFGELWVSIVPQTFSVIVTVGQTLNQLRFFTADTRLTERELETSMDTDNLIWDKDTRPFSYNALHVRDNDATIILTIDGTETCVGYKGFASDTPIDLSRVQAHDAKKYFEPVYQDGGYIHLKRNKFYILSTRESVKVPPHLACEMMPMDERSGEFRSHYAGFIDPGWGYGKDGDGVGRPLTLEVRPFEDLIIRDNQSIAKIRFEKMQSVPDKTYDDIESNYIVQNGPKLAKQFIE